MALNLSTLTSPATSGDVLAEALTTADFLEPVPVLRNLARGSQKGGDAKQDVALNQPKALPLIDGEGYFYLPRISGNQAEVNSAVLPQTSDFDLRVEFIITETPEANKRFEFFSQYLGGSDGRLIFGITPDLRLRLFWHPHTHETNPNIVTIGKRHVARLTRVSGQNTIYIDDTQLLTFGYSGNILQKNTIIGFGNTDDRRFKGAIFSVTEGSNTNVDFTATNVRHGDTKFKCATGQVVTVNQSGNDPATIIKKPVLRFDGVNDGFKGLFANQIDGGYMFAAFSVLGDGGEAWGRIISVNKTGGSNDYTSGGMIFSYRSGSTNNLATYKGFLSEHVGLFDSSNGDILSEAKATQSATLSRVNNADEKTTGNSYTIEGDEFNIGQGATGLENAAIDLEFLALFSADSVPDEATASKIRNYINNRNNVFDLKDGFGYYFYDAQNAPVGAISSGSSAWNGRIIGSDNGDTDKLATQSTSNDAPVGSGFVVTFADNSDHLDIPSTTQAGWQVVGTSLGTFAYRVDNDAVTELNLLGNLGSASFRKAGDLYGIILLPESATGADIEAARKLLIDRGAADGTTTNNLYTAWYQRDDIVEFKHTDTSGVTSANDAWGLSDNLAIFPSLNLSSCASFQRTWKSCSALTSFPAGAKLGTSASSVNFTEAWRESGLTSFNTDLPTGTIFQKTWRQSALTSFGSIDLSSGNSFNSSWQLATSLSSFGAIDARNGTNFQEAWRGCSALTSFPAGAKLGTEATNVNFNSAWRSSGLTSFSTPLPTARLGEQTWQESAVTSFSAPLPVVERVYLAWHLCSSLTDFSADVFANWNPSNILNQVFDGAWDGCTSLTAQSVENILVSIDASGKYATSTGASGGTALGDAGIDIDYNVSTGSLSAATNTAVTSLKSKGWSIIVNNVTL